MSHDVIDVQGLNVWVNSERTAPKHIVKNVNFSLKRGQCLALVGESGSGKSVTARALVGLAGDRLAVQAERLTLLG